MASTQSPESASSPGWEQISAALEDVRSLEITDRFSLEIMQQFMNRWAAFPAPDSLTWPEMLEWLNSNLVVFRLDPPVRLLC